MAQPFLIGINPPPSLAKQIQKLKEEVINDCGIIPGVQDIPHITLNLNRFPKIAIVEKVLAEVCTRLPPIEIKVDGISTFPGKTTTVFARVVPNAALTALQEKVSRAVALFKEGEHLREQMLKWGQQLPANAVPISEKYGYPYFGASWTPHMTIASFDTSSFNKKGKSLLNRRLSATFKFDHLTLFHWGRNVNHWTPLSVYPLRGE